MTQSALEAVFTHFAVAKEKRPRTKKAVIVQCLDDGNAQLAAGVIDCRGKYGERIVNVNYIRPLFGQQVCESRMPIRRPDGLQPEFGLIESVCRWRSLNADGSYPNPARLEHSSFRFEDFFFASAKKIAIKDRNNMRNQRVLTWLRSSQQERPRMIFVRIGNRSANFKSVSVVQENCGAPSATKCKVGRAFFRRSRTSFQKLKRSCERNCFLTKIRDWNRLG